MNINQLSTLLSGSRDKKNTVASADRLSKVLQKVLSEDAKTTPRPRCSKEADRNLTFKEMVDKYL